jgi:IS5 family transposase
MMGERQVHQEVLFYKFSLERQAPRRICCGGLIASSSSMGFRGIVKNRFRHKKLRYRGLAKNTAQLHTLFALANLVIVKKPLLAQPRA